MVFSGNSMPLKELPGTRKIAVLGDIIGLGEYSEKAHVKFGRLPA